MTDKRRVGAIVVLSPEQLAAGAWRYAWARVYLLIDQALQEHAPAWTYRDLRAIEQTERDTEAGREYRFVGELA